MEKDQRKEFSPEAPTRGECYLGGKMLIASPAMRDTNFERAVIYMCLHNREGALGIIVNRKIPDICLSDLLEQMNIKTPDASQTPVHIGGPVETRRGFVLHSADYCAPKGTMRINADTALTGTTDVLRQIASGSGPERAFLALGYAGWGPGQLDRELSADGWLTCSRDEDLLFSSVLEDKYSHALEKIGVKCGSFSSQMGRA